MKIRMQKATLFPSPLLGTKDFTIVQFLEGKFVSLPHP